jgi:amidase
MEFYLGRVEKYDSNGPRLSSIIEILPTVKQEAAALDVRFNECRSTVNYEACFDTLGRLACIPVLVKDNIATKEMTTAAGSLALVGSIVPGDSTVISNLRKEGAIIFGKTGMSEWSNFRGTNSLGFKGWSGRGGQVINPYGPNYTVSGSSSGCGVAIAANLATVCIGTETHGSITAPSLVNGIYGFRPPAQSMPLDGIIPISSDEDAPKSYDSNRCCSTRRPISACPTSIKLMRPILISY